MRIISGKYKGRRLTAPKNLPVRPTTDMAKEALFNIINNEYYFETLSVLDLFAGTGNISYEFASRGVPQITSVDRNSGCVRYMNTIAEEFEFNLDIRKFDVFKYLEQASGSYKLIFADPPYDLDQSLFEKIITLVFEKNLLTEEGTLIVEHSKHTKLIAESLTKCFVDCL